MIAEVLSHPDQILISDVTDTVNTALTPIQTTLSHIKESCYTDESSIDDMGHRLLDISQKACKDLVTWTSSLTHKK